MGRKSKYTKELLGPIIAASKSVAEVLRALGLAPAGGGTIDYLGLESDYWD